MYEEQPGVESPQRRLLELEGRLFELESTVRVQRRMLVPVSLVTSGSVLALASFGLIHGARATEDLIGGWAALFFVYLLIVIPLTWLAVTSRSGTMRWVAVATWAALSLLATCMGAGPRGALAAALGVAPWYLLGATAIVVLGLLRLPRTE